MFLIFSPPELSYKLPAKDCIPEYVPDLRDVSQTNAGPDLRDCAGVSSPVSQFNGHEQSSLG